MTIDVTNKSESAYDKLEKMIIFQDLKPGSMVSEKQLSEILDLGRTPVREALQRLSYERMVEIHPRRGIQIPTISIESQLKILEVRRDIEALCIRYAASRASTQQKQNMLLLAESLEQCATENDEINFSVLLKKIHAVLVEAANNDYLALAMAPLQGLSRRFWFANKNVTTDLATAASLHACVLRAVCHTDVSEAVDASHQLNDYLTDMVYRSIGVVK